MIVGNVYSRRIGLIVSGFIALAGLVVAIVAWEPVWLVWTGAGLFALVLLPGFVPSRIAVDLPRDSITFVYGRSTSVWPLADLVAVDAQSRFLGMEHHFRFADGRVVSVLWGVRGWSDIRRTLDVRIARNRAGS